MCLDLVKLQYSLSLHFQLQPQQYLVYLQMLFYNSLHFIIIFISVKTEPVTIGRIRPPWH